MLEPWYQRSRGGGSPGCSTEIKRSLNLLSRIVEKFILELITERKAVEGDSILGTFVRINEEALAKSFV